MESAKHDLTVIKGSTFKLTITLDAGASPLDLTGFKARAQMREEYESTNAFLTFTSDDSTITLGGVDGTVILKASATNTAAIIVDSGVWDLELVDPTGEVQQVLYGSVTIRQEATRNTNA